MLHEVDKTFTGSGVHLCSSLTDSVTCSDAVDRDGVGLSRRQLGNGMFQLSCISCVYDCSVRFSLHGIHDSPHCAV